MESPQRRAAGGKASAGEGPSPGTRDRHLFLTLPLRGTWPLTGASSSSSPYLSFLQSYCKDGVFSRNAINGELLGAGAASRLGASGVSMTLDRERSQRLWSQFLPLQNEERKITPPPPSPKVIIKFDWRRQMYKFPGPPRGAVLVAEVSRPPCNKAGAAAGGGYRDSGW